MTTFNDIQYNMLKKRVRNCMNMLSNMPDNDSVIIIKNILLDFNNLLEITNIPRKLITNKTLGKIIIKINQLRKMIDNDMLFKNKILSKRIIDFRILVKYAIVFGQNYYITIKNNIFL